MSPWLTDSPKAATALAGSLRVLLVVEDPCRRQVLQRCLQEHLPDCSVEVVDSYFDAMARATRMQAQLLVLDLSLDSVLVPALKRFLARAAPQVHVHVFDESSDGPRGVQADADRPSIEHLKQAFAALSGRPTQPH